MSKEYIYNFNYQFNEKELCVLEVKSLLGMELDHKVSFSNVKVDPSVSPFLKNRLEIIYKATSFDDLMEFVEKSAMTFDEYKVKYLKLFNDDPYFKERRVLCKKVGLEIGGVASFKSPKTCIGISFYEGSWYLGFLIENSRKWQEHKVKPHSYSSSLNIKIAKALVNIASNGELSKKIIDPCCGVGTVILEGLFAGYDISGWEINSKVAENAKVNLRHFNYQPDITCGDIQDIEDHFDVSIVDLPYGIVCKKSVENQAKIIKNAKRISKKVVLLSSVDILDDILKAGLEVTDYCTIMNDRKGGFSRYVWVCE